MGPGEFMKIWGVGRSQLGELLGLKPAQIARWFFPPDAKNYQEPKQSHCDRLGEIHELLKLRSELQQLRSMSRDFADSEAIERLNTIVPPKKSK
jgi:hypothetical protein